MLLHTDVCTRTETHGEAHNRYHCSFSALKLASSSLEGVGVWCTVTAHKIFRGPGPLSLIWKSMNCSVCTAHWMYETTLEVFKLKEQAADYTQQMFEQ